MTVEEIKAKVQAIVRDALALHVDHVKSEEVVVNYVCIFSQQLDEFEKLTAVVDTFGTRIEETPTGPVYKISPINTNSGDLRLLKIRMPDIKRPERGDADFTVENYNHFKQEYIDKPGFSLIKRPGMEMIELYDSGHSVLAYYSNPTLEESLKNKGVLLE